ncbi:MAG: class I SAM-dependent methyltransferase [Bdellovibrionota bacterium]
MSEIDPSKINPFEPVKKMYQLYLEDMLRYTDPSTGDLKQELQVKVEDCPACGINTNHSSKIFQKGPFHFYQCDECTLVYVNPRLCDEHTEALYREGRCMYQLKNFYLPTAEYRKENLYKRKLGEIETKKAKGTLLDFGSSTGYFLQTAQEGGWDAYGVELNPVGVAWAREKLGLTNVFNKYLAECGFDQNKFDVITMWDVLEHLTDPYPILLELHEYLKDDGLIVIETSHYDCFETEVLGSENTNIAGDMHLTHFNKLSLQTLLERAGFKIIEFDIFGLDIKHILDYQKLTNTNHFSIAEEKISSEQERIDNEEKGCYIKVLASKK